MFFSGEGGGLVLRLRSAVFRDGRVWLDSGSVLYSGDYYRGSFACQTTAVEVVGTSTNSSAFTAAANGANSRYGNGTGEHSGNGTRADVCGGEG